MHYLDIKNQAPVQFSKLRRSYFRMKIYLHQATLDSTEAYLAYLEAALSWNSPSLTSPLVKHTIKGLSVDIPEEISQKK